MMDIEEEDLRLIEVFRQKAADASLEAQMHALAQFDTERKRRHEHQLREEAEARQLVEALATPAEFAAFNSHMDEYDTATVHALMKNQNAMEVVLGQRKELEASAFRLPDGRMAFKTEDGHRVFDQHGAELTRDTIESEAIPDSAPRWEAKHKIDMSEARLNRERDELHSYQERLDETREAAAKDGASAKALTQLEADLKLEIPDSVRQELTPNSPAALKTSHDANVSTIQMPGNSRYSIGPPSGP